MRLLKAFCTLLALLLFAQQTPLPYGPQGAEGEPNRAQPWWCRRRPPTMARAPCCFVHPATGRFTWP